MPRLSILIPAHNHDAALEASLVSVLEHRPDDCEIVVVTNEDYADPYGLAGEVRFVSAPVGYCRLGRIKRGLRACRGPIVHLLACGAEVSHGWTDAALAHFADPRVASVAVLLLEREGRRIRSAGIDYRSAGARVARLAGRAASDIGQESQAVLGADLAAGFFRLAAWQHVPRGLERAIGERLADVDLALQLAAAGYRSVLEPRAQVRCGELERNRPLSDAWLAERLFWRHAARLGWLRAVLGHAVLLARESAAVLVRPLTVGRLVGRAAGWLENLYAGGRLRIRHVAPAHFGATLLPHLRLDAAQRSAEGRNRGASRARAAR